MTNAKLDYKKEYKDLYQPKAKPAIVEVPPICFIMVDGKGNPDTSKARLQIYHEGLCVQMMHIGPFDKESETVTQIDAFIKDNNLQNAIDDVQPDGTIKKHHEIYLGDPRKIDPSKWKTILRHPVKL